MESEERVVITPEEGKSVSLGALGVIHKISGRDTGGSFSVVEHPMEPGTLGALPHTHTNEDEYSFVLEGEVGVLIGDDEYRATPGTYILKPRGVPHTFWNPGPIPRGSWRSSPPRVLRGTSTRWPRCSRRRPEDLPTSTRWERSLASTG